MNEESELLARIAVFVLENVKDDVTAAEVKDMAQRIASIFESSDVGMRSLAQRQLKGAPKLEDL